MTNNNKLRIDGIRSLIGGMNSGIDPNLLPPSMAAMLINVLVRGGFAETRYGFPEWPFVFENDEHQEWFEDNLFQGAEFFDPTGRDPMFVASVGGRIWKIDVLNDFRVSEITPVNGTTTSADFLSPPLDSSTTVSITDTTNIYVGYPVTIGTGSYMVTAKTLTTITATNLDATAGANVASGTPVYFLLPNPSLLPKTWMLQAEGFFLIQNGLDGCIIYDGATARRAVRSGQKLEVPTGTAMAYWQGRIWVAVNKRNIEAGDIIGQTQPGATTIIDFTEATYLNEGGPFRVPSGAGDITALKVLPVLDTSLGQGALQVHTENGISTINLPVDRDRWKDVDSLIQPIALLGAGATSDKSTWPVNMDMFFRAPDGVRSYRMSRQDQAGTWSNTPISREMNRVLEHDHEKFLQHSSAAVFRNLLLFTVNPLPFNSGRAAYWRGLGVLDFDPISSMGQKAPPVWTGLWQGVNIMQIVKGTFRNAERCFLFVRNAENKNEIWEVDPEHRFDGVDGKIRCRIESRGLNFGTEEPHNLQSALLRIDQLHGEADFRLYYRPDASPCWLTWGEEKTRCATVRECEVTEECQDLTEFQPGYKTKIGWGQPDNTCEEFDNKPARLGYVHEVALEWDGWARIKLLRIKANEESESSHPDCLD